MLDFTKRNKKLDSKHMLQLPGQGSWPPGAYLPFSAFVASVSVDLQ